MGTTLDHATVGCLNLTDVADRLVETQLKTRDGLPHANNGRPKAPSNAAAAQIRKDMKNGRSSEYERLLTVVDTDLEDGVPYDIATAPLQRMLTFLKIRADAMHRGRERSLPRCIRDEARTQHALEMVDWRLMETASRPSPAELEEAIRKAEVHIAALRELQRGCDEALVAAEHAPAASASRIAFRPSLRSFAGR